MMGDSRADKIARHVVGVEHLLHSSATEKNVGQFMLYTTGNPPKLIGFVSPDRLREEAQKHQNVGGWVMVTKYSLPS